MEGQNAIKHKVKTDLSEQELVDCAGSFGNDGCKGGVMEYAFKYIQSNGISTASAYPYVAVQRSCSKSSHARASLKVSGYRSVGANERALQAAVCKLIKFFYAWE